MKVAKLPKASAVFQRPRILRNTNNLQLYLMCVIPLGLFFRIFLSAHVRNCHRI